MLMNHIPDKYEHLVRYYGYYSNRSRGARQEATALEYIQTAEGYDGRELIEVLKRYLPQGASWSH